MKKSLLSILVLVLISFATPIFVGCSNYCKKEIKLENLKSELMKLDGVVSVENVEFDTLALPYVKARYCIMIEQKLDINNPESGVFNQRFILSHAGFDKPMVFITEGYSGAYGLRPKYASELAKHYEANEAVIEHRFFQESTPDSLAWEYMRGPYAADDLHKINQQLREIYNDNKFITTGISKGGQTTMFYKMYYPEDADLSVPYVGPLCFGVEDGRHEPFIDACGTPEERQIIREYQREVLKRRPAMRKMLAEYNAKNNYTYRTISLDELLDYCVLEAPFAIWQWGTPVSSLPSTKATDKELFDTLLKVANPEYFSAGGSTESFYVQALAELGYYGYDLEPFEDLLVVKSDENYLRDIFVPIDARDTKFDVTQANRVVEYFDNNDPKMVFIYGEYDPWTAAAPHDSLFVGKKNMKKYTQPKGSHSVRINTNTDEVKSEIYAILDKWLAE